MFEIMSFYRFRKAPGSGFFVQSAFGRDAEGKAAQQIAEEFLGLVYFKEILTEWSSWT